MATETAPVVDANPAFLWASIDRAIVMTQYDLRGFAHPLGFRYEKFASAKCFSYIPGNFIGFAAGYAKTPQQPTIEYSMNMPFEEQLEVCKKLRVSCECRSQVEAIQLIVKEILEQHKQYQILHPADSYVKLLQPDNYWGKPVLALAQAFEVEVPS
ncbi:MAG: hypothetical protein A3C88_00230 [Candidatus Yanofskybacteria bacterium RIFCSPHIGHO2_02_FULL_50_12]|uniref:Uncharacterized protein n=1 Tax=Candidatus Yanofskybacteria bacterium RIFCSPHIGHO2_02_FULL_50_12 TaxID=1802685 RepID=A0A1F8FUW5_9BACT|nr:MAG: hypothetical protein A3C88_00230 [Candidatus Yanofskybacteria bacterium RIFCSPHIGHO2_02_FULL_50_12]